MDLARYEDTVFNYLNTEQSALIIAYVCFDINIDKPMKKNRLFLIITIAIITGLEIMTGCSHNQETLTWVEVISDIRNRYPDVKQLQTTESNPKIQSSFIVLWDIVRPYWQVNYKLWVL
jgi:hypothetical protein